MKIAVLIPCYNEEFTVGKVVDDFHKELPEAAIYVFDNASDDKTFYNALKHGAICKKEEKRGKGNVVRRMFDTVKADIYVMVDGDDTYEASHVKELVDAVKNGADMAIGNRMNYISDSIVRKFGNKFINQYIKSLFRSAEKIDVLSGYRAFSKKFVKDIKLEYNNFEVETEMTIFALKKGYNIVTVPVQYRDRPAGSFSKLRTFRDGLSILACISHMYWSKK